MLVVAYARILDVHEKNIFIHQIMQQFMIIYYNFEEVVTFDHTPTSGSIQETCRFFFSIQLKMGGRG